jgi:hypothetical protein
MELFSQRQSVLDRQRMDLIRTIARMDFHPRLDSYVVVNFPIGHPSRRMDEGRWEY